MPSHEGCTYKRGRVWWISFYDHDGRRHQQSTGTRDRKEAKRILRRKLAEVDKGQLVIAPTRLTVRELLDDLEEDYRLKGPATVRRPSRH